MKITDCGYDPVWNDVLRSVEQTGINIRQCTRINSEETAVDVSLMRRWIEVCKEEVQITEEFLKGCGVRRAVASGASKGTAE